MFTLALADVKQARNGVDDKRFPVDKMREGQTDSSHMSENKLSLMVGWLGLLCFRRRMTAEVEPNALATLHP